MPRGGGSSSLRGEEERADRRSQHVPTESMDSTATLVSPFHESGSIHSSETLGRSASGSISGASTGPSAKQPLLPWPRRWLQHRIGPIRTLYLVLSLLLVVAALSIFLPLYIPRPLTFSVLDVEGIPGQLTILDADSWTAPINVTLRIENPNRYAIDYGSLRIELSTPFYPSVLATAQYMQPLSVPKEGWSTLRIPMTMSYSLLRDNPLRPGEGGLDIAVSCGYLGRTFSKPFYYTLRVLGLDHKRSTDGIDLIPHYAEITASSRPYVPTLWAADCPFTMQMLPSNLKKILPSNVQALTTVAAVAGDGIGGGARVIQSLGDISHSVNDRLNDLSSIGSAIANWFS